MNSRYSRFGIALAVLLGLALGAFLLSRLPIFNLVNIIQ